MAIDGTDQGILAQCDDLKETGLMLSLGGYLEGLKVRIVEPKQQSSLATKLSAIGITDPHTVRILEQSLTIVKRQDPLVSTVFKAMVNNPGRFEQSF